jgi:hypothetical protein
MRFPGSDRYEKQLFIIVCALMALLLVILSVKVATAGTRPCGTGGNRRQDIRMARCLTKQPGISTDTARAIRILKCEGANQYQGGAPYYGFWQLLRAEFDTFWHQGPAWVKAEFRKHRYGIFSARAQTLAVLSHARRYGFGWSSCA